MTILVVVFGFMAFLMVGLWFGLPSLLKGSDAELYDPSHVRRNNASSPDRRKPVKVKAASA